jgi:LETM1 and EF-hand domain-containing protein 1
LVIFVCWYYHFQIELYNSVVEKEGTDGEEEAKRAYKAAREESDHATETTGVGHKVSSALIDRVTTF